MANWSFNITDEKKLDWRRLEADALAEGLDSFVVELKSSDFVLLFVRNTLLEKVISYDRMSLCKYSLCNSWGKETAPELFESKGGFEVKYNYYGSERIYHYRYLILQSNVFDIDEIKATLETLRNFKRKTEVKVTAL